MRISDWSSDVCSSDLQPLGTGLLPAQGRLDRVAELLLRTGHALNQLDGLATSDVDGGQQLQVVTHATDPRRHPHADLTRSCTVVARRPVVGHPGGSERLDPVAQELGSGVTGLLRVELGGRERRSEEHTSELQSLMRSSYAFLCL